MPDVFAAAVILAIGFGVGLAFGLHWGHQRGWNDAGAYALALSRRSRGGHPHDDDAGTHG